MPPRTPAAPKPLLPAGTYWCAVVAETDGSGINDVYGPYLRKANAEEAAKDLREAGIHPHQAWDVMPLRLIDLGDTHE